jgi:hypothetical protein
MDSQVRNCAHSSRCASPGMTWKYCHTLRCHPPRRRRIQYAAASRFNHCRLWNTGSPLSRGRRQSMTWPSRDMFCPSFAMNSHPPNRGRREDRVRAAPAVSCAIVDRKGCTRAYRFGGSIPAFPAQWLYGLFRSLPGERLFCLRRPRDAFAPFGLNASTTAPGPNDFTVRLSHTRPSRPRRPSHPTARQ